MSPQTTIKFNITNKRKDKKKKKKMENKEILTAEALLKKKDIISGINNTEYYSNFLNGVIKIDRLPSEQVCEIMQNEDKTYFERQCELIYMSCPCFRDENLIKGYDATMPYNVVDEIFKSHLNELAELCEIVLGLYGFSNAGEEIKKQ